MMADETPGAGSPGRVVLHIESGPSSPLALKAAVRIASALRGVIEVLVVENQELLDLAELPFAREISRSGRIMRPLDSAAIQRDIHNLAQSVFRQVEEMAQAAEVALQSRVVRARPAEALARVCRECAEEHFVALGEPLSGHSLDKLRQLFEVSEAARGLVVVGPRGSRLSGPVAILIEDVQHVDDLVATASRLMPAIGTSIIAVVLGKPGAELRALEDATRKRVARLPEVRVTATPASSDSEAIEVLRRLEAGLVISRFGGMTTASNEALSALASALECPLLLVR
ncbi:MAG: hypothetical protein F9K44_03405 [Hyphomicrobiaceae bacterium]|nr:MAG: hypothetical protein F9K44_03405 [Hyphomicrobiaceae bacterium]